VYVKNTVRPGVKFLEHASNDYIWIQLSKSFFGLNSDIYICFIYDPPEGTSFTKKLNYNILELVENDVIKYSEKGHIILAGDLNARTSNDLDFINMDSDKHLPLNDSRESGIDQWD